YSTKAAVSPTKCAPCSTKTAGTATKCATRSTEVQPSRGSTRSSTSGGASDLHRLNNTRNSAAAQHDAPDEDKPITRQRTTKPSDRDNHDKIIIMPRNQHPTPTEV
ncbi:unnamed protein product, partial [Ectocarpus sp. 13 AM-2016]